MVTNRLHSHQWPLSNHFPHENGARERLAQPLAPTPSGGLLVQGEATHRPVHFRSVLVLLDGTAHGERALPLAVSIAKQAAASLRLLHVYAPVQGDFYPPSYSGVAGDHYRRQAAYVRRIAQQVGEAAEIAVVPQCIRRHNVAQGICEVASRSVDLVVATTRGHGWLERVWSGSMTHELVDRLNVPMLLLRGDGLRASIAPQRWLRRMLIPLDGSQQAEQVLNPATALGSLFDAEYSLLSVAPRSVVSLSAWSGDEARKKQIAAHDYLRRAVKRMRRRSPKAFGHFEVTKESVATAIVKRAEVSDVDCIAMARGHQDLRRWLQPSVTHRVIELARVPILVLPPAAQRRVQYEPAHS